MYTTDKSTKRWTLTSLKIDEPFGVRFHFGKILWEPMSVGVRVILLVEDNTMGKHLHPYIESGTLRAYTCMYTVQTHQQGDRLSHHQKFDEPFGVRFHFGKTFWEPMSVGVRVVLLVEDDTMGKHLHPYIESRTLRVNMYVHSGLINKEIGFHTSKNLTGLSALGSILKIF
jgi:hypothetical protein